MMLNQVKYMYIYRYNNYKELSETKGHNLSLSVLT